MPSSNELQKYGEPLTYDKSFKGPREKRSCTDVLWLLIFTVFLGGWGYVAYYAVHNGDMNTLLTPTDSFNHKCGLDSSVIDKPYLFFFNLQKCIDPFVPINGCPTPQICVKECPHETFVFNEWRGGNINELRNKLICTPDIDKDLKIKSYEDAKKYVDAERCARWYVKSKPFSRRCIPNDPEGIDKVVNAIKDISRENITTATEYIKLLSSINGLGQKVVEDIISSWTVILVALILALFASLIFIAIMRWLAAPMVWFSLIGVCAALIYGIVHSVKQYLYWKNTPTVPQHSPTLGSAFKNITQAQNTWLYSSIFLSIVFLIVFFMIIFLRKRIVIAIALIKEGSKAVSTIFSSVFFPIFPWILHIAVIAFAIAVGLYLASVGEPAFKVLGSVNEADSKCTCFGGNATSYKSGSRCNPKEFLEFCKQDGDPGCVDAGCFFEKIQNPKIVGYFHAYNVIAFFWLVFFISAFGEMVLAATFAAWYWTFHKSEVPYFILTKAFFRTIRYHLGTIALGSLIITICRLIRLMLEYIDEKLKNYDNPITRGILTCMKCFFWCLEKFLRFINKNAYIMCAIHGKNFCTSAKDAFNLLMRNVIRVVTLDKVTDFVFFMSKLFLTIAAGASIYFYLLKYSDHYQLHYAAVPTVVVVIGTYLMTSVFFGVYSMAVDTLFLCFLEDSERNDGSPEKPYFMSKRLMKILGKRNEIPRDQYN